MGIYTELAYKHLPSILTAGGILAFGSAVATMHKFAPRVKAALDELPAESTMLEKIKVAAPIYATPAALFLVGVGLTLYGNNIALRREAASLMLYSITQRKLDGLKTAVVDTATKKVSEEIFEKAITPEAPPPAELISKADRVMVCYDVNSGQYFSVSSAEDIHAAVNEINSQAIGEDFATLNDFYHILGLNPMYDGDKIGWYGDQLLDVTLKPIMRDGIPVVHMDFDIRPRRYDAY